MDSGKTIVTSRNIYLNIVDNVDLFNCLFGRHMFYVMAMSTIQCLAIWLLSLNIKNNEFSNTIYTYYSNIIFNLEAIFFPYVMTLCCDLTQGAGQRLLVTCYSIQNAFKITSEEHKELELFANRIINRKIVFRAANFFDLDRRTMLAIFFNVTTYFIALTQVESIKQMGKL
ncbi:hypothetical protein ABEB36_005909 [Hypothenemus hampei]|uniref:Uncharacterized protein n=1 Tax=Hypothenemus hampei TaxID=57062 RepID=A0ABD1EZX9_HYPHA